MSVLSSGRSGSVLSTASGRARTWHDGFGPQGWLALILSRMLVLVSGIVGALAVARRHGWQAFDVHHMSSSLGSVGNTLAASSVRWDAIHYLYLAQSGYREVQDTVFFPLYPALIRGLGYVVRSDVVAGVLISVVSFAVALVLLHRIAREELGVRQADATVWLLAFAPLSFFFTAIYTESLFLALTLAAFYCARQERFGFACLLGAAAALTRVPGFLIVVPIALFYLESPKHLRRARRGRVLWLAAPLVALGAFLVYMQHEGFGWSAPIKNQTGHAHAHTFAGPIWTLIHGVGDGVSGLWHILRGATILPSFGSALSDNAENFLLLVVLLVCLATLVLAWQRLPRAYTIYAGLLLLLCLWSPVTYRPLMSLDRYALVIFPLWIAGASWLSDRRAVAPVVAMSAVMLCFYTICFAAWAFVA